MIDANSRDRLIRTVIGEAAGEGPAGWAAVAHVIKNRADSGKWGDPYEGGLLNTLSAPKQFAVWNQGDPAGQLAMKYKAGDPVYDRIGAVVDSVFDGSTPDPTNGATHYYATKSMAPPSWAAGQRGQQIGNQTFYRIPLGDRPVGPEAATDAAGGSGRFTSPSAAAYAIGDTPGVDPRLHDILQTAASQFPGYTVRVTSGERQGDPRFHGKGMATDIQLIDPNGQPVKNYQNADSFRTYEQFAQVARTIQQQKYPDLNQQFRWGGYFSGRPGKYGAADLMHFDLGGSDHLGMAGGSWEGGLTPQQLSFYPGAKSVGMASNTPGVTAQPGETMQFTSLNTGDTQQQETPMAKQPAKPASRMYEAQGSKSQWLLPNRLGPFKAPPPAQPVKKAAPAGGGGKGGGGGGGATRVRVPLPPVDPRRGGAIAGGDTRMQPTFNPQAAPVTGPAPGTPGAGKPGELGTAVPAASRMPGIPALPQVDTMGSVTGYPAQEPEYPRYGSPGSTPQALPAIPGVSTLPAVDTMGSVTGGGSEPSYPYQPATARPPVAPQQAPLRTYPPMAGADMAAANSRNPANLVPPTPAPAPAAAPPASSLNQNSGHQASPIPAFGGGGADAPPVRMPSHSAWEMPKINMPSFQTPQLPAVDPMGSPTGQTLQPAPQPAPRLGAGGGGYQVQPLPDPGPGGAGAPPIRQPAAPQREQFGPRRSFPSIGKPIQGVMPGSGLVNSGGAQGSSWLGRLFGG